MGPDRHLVARQLGALFVAGGLAGALWLVVPHAGDGRVSVGTAYVALSVAIGLALLSGRRWTARPAVLKGLLLAAPVLVLVTVLNGGALSTGLGLYFLWHTPYAFFFGLRFAAIQGGVVASCVTTAFVALGQRQSVGLWLLYMATLIVLGVVVHRLTSLLVAADRERLKGERRRAEAELRRLQSERERARREAAIARLGRLALRAQDRGELLAEAVAVLTSTLDVEHCDILELRADSGALRRVAVSGIEPVDDDVPADDQLLGGWVLAGEEPTVVDDWERERRFQSPGLRRLGFRSTAAAAIRGRSGAFGVVGVHSRRAGAFTGDEAQWLQSVADMLASAMDRERSEAVVRHQSLHDTLTGLPNRALLFDRIQLAFSRAERRRGSVAVLLLDVDEFKTVNDSLGHQAGDDLLVQLAVRLQRVVRGSDTVARLGGDEFVVLCDVESEAEAFEIAGRIGAAWEQPFPVGPGEVFASASVGIAVAASRTPPVKMLREADAAMYRAKERGRGRSELFDETMRRHAMERLQTENDLRRALERDEFRVHYQPVVDLNTRRPIAVEALLRWQHPERGLVAPADFIPLAEDTGLIAPLGRWVLEEATREVGQWRRRFGLAAELGVTVNVSGHQLARPEFLAEVEQALEASGLRPESLGLEITESVLMKDVAGPRSTLEAIRALGVRISLDDFGTGYSSLARLQSFPLDAIKVDRSFVDGLGHEDEDSAIVAAVVDIARSMRLQVIAEGVETEEQLARLHELGCHAGQGYFWARPLEPAALEAFLAEPGAEEAPDSAEAVGA